jgi:hypothetical protein
MQAHPRARGAAEVGDSSQESSNAATLLILNVAVWLKWSRILGAACEFVPGDAETPEEEACGARVWQAHSVKCSRKTSQQAQDEGIYARLLDEVVAMLEEKNRHVSQPNP